KIRERWLASAIANLGPQMALAHLQEETEKLLRGEVERAEWYQHVSQCKEFCNHVVSGLLFEHVQQVRSHPHHLVLFGTGSTDVGEAEADPLSAFLETSSVDSRFLLIGRSSRSGNRALNRELSRQRVQSVLQFLVDQGIPRERTNSFWLGYEPPQLSPELARIYDLDDTLPSETLNQSVLLVALEEPEGSDA
ncbi:MAG: OmpA family protein, partial [Acidobacteria bacterium]|nr:OmpA family protein [Acidobacteriota bacterium]